ncbi:MAG: flagellar hook-associated protein FlgK [Novosphingobium sp. 32-60-15]|uniref:flagellar hook-associated protein FlgK n=1 Tax=unclassified Novosphingobium TaxID=2644732 RepID=UPI000BD76F78|nr:MULTISPECIES: flagellar hook-associated protein FlgK [unclassified Novosphingobium]OYX61539.1 MAG: flagellar hook-associated protein FlgK [Novosphingobium sp. 32-60-15]
MASDLLSIGRSGALAARIGLDVTAQNIANASTEGYVRRSAQMAEVASTGGAYRIGDLSLSGVRLDSITRNADAFRQAEVRRTGSDVARGTAEAAGLSNIESAIEQSGVYDAIVGFESSLQQLTQDPVDTSLRAAVIEKARTMVGTFQIASQELDAAGEGLQFLASDGVTQINRIATELARTNTRLSRASDATSDKTSLLDQRDKLLQQLSQFGNIGATFAVDGTVAVKLGGTTGRDLVVGGTAGTVGMTTAANGTLSFDVDGNSVALSGGSLAGQQLALDKLAQLKLDVDGLAEDIVTTFNAAQLTGDDLNGDPGAAIFSGTTAATMTLAVSDVRKLATAPLNDPIGSRNAGNLTAIRSAISGLNPADGMDQILFDISGTLAGRNVTLGALQTIADTAQVALSAQSGVDLDAEAVNLVRYQQAFQASGKVMQVASDIFDTLLGIG